MTNENHDIDNDLDNAFEGMPHPTSEETPESEEVVTKPEEEDEIFTPDELPAADIPKAPAPVVTSPETAPKSIGAGIKDAPTNNLSLSERAARTKLILSKEPRYSTIIPLSPGEKMGAVKTVNINGYRFEIKKSTPVNLPKTVWQIVMKSMKASMENTANHPLNLNNADDSRKKALNLA